MTTQPSMFEQMLATVRGRQGDLFAEVEGPPVGLSCSECGRAMIRTESGYLSCPMAHGKLLTEAAEPEEDEDDAPAPASDWPRQARQIAKRHAERDNWHGRRWHCRCGACQRARMAGFVPRIER